MTDTIAALLIIVALLAGGAIGYAATEIGKAPNGARFERRTTFRNLEGKLLVSAVTSWAMIDRTTGRLTRVPRDVAAQFLPDPD